MESVIIEEITDQTGYYGDIYRFVIVRRKWRWKRRTPGRNRYAGGRYAVTESDIWLMRYHKNILFAVNCKTTRKNKFEIKVFIFGSKKNICTFALKLSPRTGIVRNNMNIRKDKELNILAKAAGKKATEVETIIVNQLIQKEMIQTTRNFGDALCLIVSNVTFRFLMLSALSKQPEFRLYVPNIWTHF